MGLKYTPYTVVRVMFCSNWAAFADGNRLRYTCAMLRSGEILTALTDTITLPIFAVCIRNISLNSFWINRAMRDCRVDSIYSILVL